MVTDSDIYNFDLNGFVVLKGVLSLDEVTDLERQLDAIPPLKPGEWFGHVHRQDMPEERGVALQQIYEGGPAFERLIDHPAYIEHVKRFVGNQDDFDALHGPLYIDECFSLTRGPGGFIGMHSGGHQRTKRTQFRYHNGQFSCGQINVFIPLTDIGPGDGGTLVVPGSHKSNFPVPKNITETTVEVHLNRGDVLLFVDALRHGSATRTNPGLRKVVIYRFGPSWGNSRFGYLPSKALLQRLTPAQRQIVQPQTYRLPPHLKAEDLMEALQLTSPAQPWLVVKVRA
jgi:ectoine hydroxylase-related dioxygenase (phytanoyl-CoA dioxygenase family)